MTVLALMGASSMIGGARAAGTAVAVPTFSLTAQYKSLNVSITNETTTHSGTINYVVHYSTSSSITNKTQNITTKYGQHYVDVNDLIPGTTYYVAVDSVNGTAYSSLSSAQSAVVDGVFSFNVGQIKIVKVSKGNSSGDFNITVPIAALTGASFNAMQLYAEAANISASSLLSSSPVLLPSKNITKSFSNWTFNDVSLPSGTSYLYVVYNFTVSAGYLKGSYITEVGSPAYQQHNGGSLGGFFVGTGGLDIFLTASGIILAVLIISMISLLAYWFKGRR